MADINEYSIGDLVGLTATFTTTATGAEAAPTAVTILVRDPEGASSTPAVTTPSVGVYTATVVPTLPGVWRWRATGTGAAQAKADGFFRVRPNTF